MKLEDCKRCGLRKTAIQVVPGEGLRSANIMVVGEAPGADEDRQGRPFVGRSGELLRKTLADAGVKDKELYVTNVIHCKPPENRTPTSKEIERCSIWIKQEIKRVQPKIILAVGETSMQFLLGFKGISTRRGRRHKSEYGDVFVTYHPAAALRRKSFKESFTADISRLVRLVRGEVKQKEKLESITMAKGGEDRGLVHLHVHDEFSILDGCGTCEEFVATAKHLGMSALAQTNHRSISGVPSFLRACDKGKIKPIVGCEIEVVEDMYDKSKETRGQAQHLTVWCDGNAGYENLLKLVTLSNTEGFYYKPRLDWATIKTHKGNLVFGTACLGGPLCKAIMDPDAPKPDVVAKRLKKIFGDNLFVEIMGNDLLEQKKANAALVDLAAYHKLPLLATADAHYPTHDYAAVHDILLMVQTKSTIKTTNRFRFETKQLSLVPSKVMRSRLLRQGLPESAVRKALKNTTVLARQLGVVKLPKFDVKDALPFVGTDDDLRKLAKGRWKIYRRKVKQHETYKDRLAHELSVIGQHGLGNYFLMAWDMIKFCRQSGIRTGSRGSAAGSLVAFLLGITKVDPIKYGLMFERFLGPERLESGNLPDIDLDIDYNRREELVSYVQHTYGDDHVAPSCTFSRLRGKVVFRDVARTQLVPAKEVDLVSKVIPGFKKGDEESEDVFSVLEDAVQQSELFRKFKEKYPLVVDAALKLEGQVRHLSIHAAGYIVSKDLLTSITPIIKTGSRFATGYEARDLERMGLTKFDLLGLRTLTVIEQTKKIVSDRGEHVDVDNLPFGDKRVYEEFGLGHTRGIFQFDGSAPRLLKQWDAGSILDLTMVNAANRPGPLQSGMAERIIRIKTGEDVEPQNPVLDELLKETHGALIYQEQVMKILREVGGLSFMDVDLIRIDIAKSKGVAAVEKYRKPFVQGARVNGFSKEDANEIFSHICEHGGYSFNRCLTSDTLVETTEGPKAISLLKPYITKVFTLTKGGNIISVDVTEVFEQGEKDCVEVQFDNGSFVRSTLDHKFLTNEGLKPLSYILLHRKEVVCFESKTNSMSGMSNTIRDSERVLSASENLSACKTVGKRQDGFSGKGQLEIVVRTNLQEASGFRTTPQGLFDVQSPTQRNKKRNNENGLGRKRCAFKEGRIRNGFADISASRNSSTKSRTTQEMAREKSREISRNSKKIQGCQEEDEFEYSHGTILQERISRIQTPGSNSVSRLQKNGRFCRQKCMDRIRWADSFLSDLWRRGLKTGRKTRPVSNVGGSFKKKSSYTDFDEMFLGQRSPQNESSLSCDFGQFTRRKNSGCILSRRIVRVRTLGKQPTYDISVNHPEHNFILSSGIVTSNSHAAVYAYLAYQTMWLKVHHPSAFIAAYLSIHSDKDSVTAMVAEALRLGIRIVPPSIENSDLDYRCSKDEMVVGFASIPHVGDKAALSIIEQRPFKSYSDFLERVDLQRVNSRVVEVLAKLGAFSFEAISNRTICEKHAEIVELKKSKHLEGKRFRIKNYEEYTEEELLRQRSELLGLPLGLMRMSEMREQLRREARRKGVSDQKWRLVSNLGHSVRSGDLVLCAIKSVREHVTKRGDTMAFITVTDESEERSLIVWPSAYAMRKEHLSVGNVVAIRPQVKKDEMYLSAENGFRCMMSVKEKAK